MTYFSDQFRKIIMRYKRIGYNLNVMRQSACLVINLVNKRIGLGSGVLFGHWYPPHDRCLSGYCAPMVNVVL